MNIFEEYIKKIIGVINKNQKLLKVENLNNFKGIILEIPPAVFNSDLSCNVALILAKLNNINTKELAIKIKDLLK